MIIGNRGMFIEQIINNSIANNNEDHDLNFILSKINTTMLVLENISENLKKSLILENNFCDYIGLYQGRYLEIEAKETEKNFFNLNLITKKQIDKLKKISQCGGIALIFVYMHQYEKLYIIDIKQILEYKNKKIAISWLEENCYSLYIDSYQIDLIKIIRNFNKF